MWQHVQVFVEAVVVTLVDDNVHYKRRNNEEEVDNKVWALASAMEAVKRHPMLQLYWIVLRYYP